MEERVLEAGMTQDEIDRRFNFYPADSDRKRNGHAAIRRAFKEMAEFIAEQVPDGREQSCAITALEESMMWSNAGYARPVR